MPAFSLPATAAPAAPGVAAAHARQQRPGATAAAAASGPGRRRRPAFGRRPPSTPTQPLGRPSSIRLPIPPAAAAAPTAPSPQTTSDNLTARFAAEAPPGGFQTPRELARRFGAEGFVEFYSGEGGLPLAFLHHPSGHSVEVYLQGATVTRWLDGARRDLLMPPRAGAAFRRGHAISSGGAPLSFPQWREGGGGGGGVGPSLEGGFSGRLEWEVVEAGVSFGVPGSGMTRTELEAECARRAGAARAAGRESEDFSIPGTSEDAETGRVRGLPADVEQYIVLRLRDSAATRAAGYPHAFELLYRVSLSYSDETADLSPQGQQAVAGAAAERRLLAAAAADGHDLEADLAAADRAAREGDEPPFEIGSARAEAVRLLRAAREARRAGRTLAADPRGGDAPLPRRRAPTGQQGGDEDDDDEAADQGAPAAVAAASKASSSSGSAAALIGMEVNRAATMPDASAAALTGRDPPIQLKMSLYARNNADGGSSGAAMRAAHSAALKAALIEGKSEEQAAAAAEAARREAEELEAERAASVSLASDSGAARAMPFEVALLPHFATLDQSSPQGRAFVRARGLGGLRALDWSPLPAGQEIGGAGGGFGASVAAAAAFTAFPSASSPRLTVVTQDYLSFGRKPVDLAASGAHEADVRLCPGDRSHYQILQRQGLRDAIARHPGPVPGSALPGGQSAARHARHCAALGAGRVVAPVRLAAGQEWRGELVVRRHGRYWEPAAWELAGEAAGAREPVPPLVVDPKSAADR